MCVKYVCIHTHTHTHTHIHTHIHTHTNTRTHTHTHTHIHIHTYISSITENNRENLNKRAVNNPTVSKEAYYRVKRDLIQCQKRPEQKQGSKEPSTTPQCQKRPITVSKET